MSSYRSKLREREGQNFHYNTQIQTPTEDVDLQSTTPPNPNSFRMSLGSGSDFAGIGIGFASIFCESVLAHPCIVMRRQCQIRHDSVYFHLTPFTIIPVMFNISRHQGFGALWKGLGSVFIVRGVGLLSETAICEVTSLPKEVTRHSLLKKLGQHMLLKSMSLVICAPFYAASLVEIVQSEIASDPPGLISCLREGLVRITHLGYSSASRLLPLWKFMPSVVLLGLSQYVIRGLVALTTHQYLHGDDDDEMNRNRATGDGETTTIEDIYHRYYCDLLTNFTSSLVADVMCYPLETVVLRLCIQGTRTLIDNTDTGLEVAPVTTAYDGFIDAVHNMAAGEGGGAGFYKGFGALVLQYSIQFLLLRLVRLAYEQLLITYGDDQRSSRPKPLRQSRSPYREQGHPTTYYQHHQPPR